MLFAFHWVDTLVLELEPFDMAKIIKSFTSVVLLMSVGLATIGAFEITPRIVGGKAAKLGQFPYYAHLDIRSFGFGKYFRKLIVFFL